MTDLTGRVALVTGGNSGVGLGTATGLARRRRPSPAPSTRSARSTAPPDPVNALLPGWAETAMTEPGKADQRFVDATIDRTPDAVTVDGGYTVF